MSTELRLVGAPRRNPTRNRGGKDNVHLFECTFPGCGLKYRRKEHLNRHAGEHFGTKLFSCPFCSRSFTRNDTMRRHTKIHARDTRETLHPDVIKTCSQCRRVGCECDLGARPRDGSQLLNLEAACVQRWLNSYFEYFHPEWPLLHRCSFDQAKEPPILIFTVAMIGLWMNGEERGRQAAAAIQASLWTSIEQQRERWDVSRTAPGTFQSTWPMATYQAILLNVIFESMRSNVGKGNMSPPWKLSSSAYEILEALLSSCLVRGMLHYPSMIQQYGRPNDLSVFSWLHIEEAKRFAVTLYRVNLYVQSGGSKLLSFRDLKFPRPNHKHLWDTLSTSEFTRGFIALDFDDSHREEAWICNSMTEFSWLDEAFAG
ncbi:putative C6 and C2H2 transcription factor [Macrophomina phaseolina]|uniref:C6 and C2H2 transcription factor n=1 Tax=Macrophomina phaseolina TaxID=35725 RepID=A0ABQ8FQZ4_9PEZI|nr:putative C6 and C2H2 transcription factor [Macrophomina phaseolina]